MTHVLYLSYDGLTDPLGQSQILPYLINLSDTGYQFTIISAEKKENYQRRKTTIQQLIANKNIDWQPIFYTKKPPILSTLKDIRQLQRKAEQVYKNKPFELVHCRSYISALVGLKLKQKYPTVRFVFDMRGFWADERVDGGLWNLGNPIFRKVYQYFKKKEKQFLQKADYTISLTHNAKNEIQSWQGFEQTPIQVIPCCVDTHLFDYKKTPQKAQNKPFTISYLGSIGTWYLLDEMLLFFKALLQNKPNARFLFITGENPQGILSKAQQYGISESHFQIQSAERKEVPTLLAESDVSIFFIKSAYSKKASSATKMGEILAMGIPIIANNNMGDHDYLFEKYTCGLLTKAFSQEAYQEVIDRLEMLLQTEKEALRHTATDYFSLEKGVTLYNEVYEKTLATAT